jgi:hypothetical protein
MRFTLHLFTRSRRRPWLYKRQNRNDIDLSSLVTPTFVYGFKVLIPGTDAPVKSEAEDHVTAIDRS